MKKRVICYFLVLCMAMVLCSSCSAITITIGGSDNSQLNEPDVEPTNTISPTPFLEDEISALDDAKFSDCCFTIDGDYYQLPISVSEFVSMGWVLADFNNDPVSPGSISSGQIINEKYGLKAYAVVRNYDPDNEVSVSDTVIVGMSFSINSDSDFSWPVSSGLQFILPQGIQLGVSTIDEAIQAYGAPQEIGQPAGLPELSYATFYETKTEIQGHMIFINFATLWYVTENGRITDLRIRCDPYQDLMP